MRESLKLFLGAGLLAGSSWIYFSNPPAVMPEINREIALRIINSGEAIKRFDGLSKTSQDEAISYLEGYVLSKTDIGRVVKELLDNVNVSEVIDDKLEPGNYYFHDLTNIISYSSPPSHLKVHQYLQGEPLIFGIAHERMHAIQDLNSKWNEFETFCSSFVSYTEDKSALINFTEKNAQEFARIFLNNSDASYDEARQKFLDLWNDYEATKNERIIIREIQAHLTFQPYTNPAGLYERMQKNHHDVLVAVGKDIFSQAFASSIELMGILDPVKAAEFVGANGESVDVYLQSVKDLKEQMNFVDAYQRGIERQNRLLNEIHQITIEAVRYISQRI